MICEPLESGAMKYRLGSFALLPTAMFAFATPSAWAWQSAVFRAVDFPDCEQGQWKAIGKGTSGGPVTGKPVGFTGCANGSVRRGSGTPNDPYRLSLDGERESVDVDGLDASTRADYTVGVWFQVKDNKKGLTMLVDSRTDRYYVPLRLMISNGKVRCSIEMPFPDRIYLASSTEAITTSRWYHAACRFRAQARELSLFLNGRKNGSTRIPPGSIRSNRIRIGGDPSVEGENFAGDIGEVFFSMSADDPETILARCKKESKLYPGAECAK